MDRIKGESCLDSTEISVLNDCMSLDTDNSLLNPDSFPFALLPLSMRTQLLQPDRVLEIVFQSLKELVDYELAVVLSIEQGNVLRVRKAFGPLAIPALENFSIGLDQRKDIAEILQSKQPKLFHQSEAHIDTYYGIIDLPSGHSCLVSPLYIEDLLVGMLTIDHRSCNRFSPSIVQFVGTISRLISVSLIQTDASTDLLKRTRVILDERNRLLDENAQVFHDLIGVSPTWMRVLDDIRLVAASELPIFITGETGTGKEQVARTIHAMSTRNQGPFIAVNCSGLVTTLAESELFGHEKGAFTGATTSRRGRFEIADGGTLFLDELGDLPLEIQPKLLRVLQDGIIERVGAEHPLHVDVRIIAATNKNLEDEMTKGNFREDLWYRINVFPIHLPPLRERDHDAILIAQYFLEKIRKRPGYGLVEFSDQAIDKILQIPWYGNVRELRNSIERAAILARGGIIHAEHIISYRDQRQAMHENVLIEKSEIGSLEEIEKHHIEKILMQTNGKIYGTDGAAAILGLKPSTLQSKMKKLGIQRPARS